MSYSCSISFITLSPEDTFDFMTSFKKACTENLKEIAKENFSYCPFIRDFLLVPQDFGTGISHEDKEKAKQWAREGVFKYKFFFIKEFSMLCMFGVPTCLYPMFDGTVYFQNSTDQDYSLDAYKGIKAFEVLWDEYMNMPDEKVMKMYKERYVTSFADDYPEVMDDSTARKEKLDYYRRSFCYHKIWSYCESHLYNNGDNVYLSIYGGYEISEPYLFIKYCHQAQLDFEKENEDIFGPIRKKKEKDSK